MRSTGRAPVDPGRHQSGGRATGWALAGAAATTAANFGIALVVARSGAALAGVFFAATAVVSMLGNATALGSMTGLLYFMPEAVDGHRPAPRALLAVALGPVVVVSVAAALALAAGAGPVARLVAPDDAVRVASMLRVMAVAVPGWALATGLLGATRGLGTMTATVTVNQVGKPLAQLSLVAGVMVAGWSPTALAVAWAVPVVASAAAAGVWVAVLGGLSGPDRGPVTATRFWRYTRARAVSTTLQIALERADVLVVSALAGTAAAGVYGTLTRYITAGNFVVFSVAQATTPSLRRAVADGDLAGARRILERATGWMVLATWPYLLVVATKAAPLSRLFAPGFDTGAIALAMLAGAVAVNAATGPIDATLLMLGRSATSMVSTAAALTVDLALAWVLVPRMGLTGAALAWGAAVVVANGSATVAVARASGLRAPGRAAAMAALGALVAVVPVAALTPSSLGGVAVTVAVGGVILAAWALRFAPTLGLAEPTPVRSSP
ncbi:MAG: lipopolysaccharide biosynthesis protein [Acidimicrobiales bacterium]